MTQVTYQQRCSVRSAADAEPLAGSAGVAERGYLLVEDPGPWGRAGIAESSLGEAGRLLEEAAKRAGVKALVFRATDREGRSRPGRRVYAATHGHHRRLVGFEVPTADDLLALDLTAYDGDLATIHPGAADVEQPLMLVCTHAKRDQCCAITGGPLGRELAAAHPESVFECSHLGGHRFAPTALILPLGAVYGRLTASSAERALELARTGRLDPALLRGLSHLAPAEQAADIALRAATGAVDLDEVRVTGVEAAGAQTRVTLATPGGAWVADVDEVPTEPRVASCGKDPEPTTQRRVTRLRPRD